VTSLLSPVFHQLTWWLVLVLADFLARNFPVFKMHVRMAQITALGQYWK